MLTQTNETKAREFVVYLNDGEVDELGVGWEDRRVAVTWDAGVTPEWESWLRLYKEGDSTDWFISEIEEITDKPEVEGEF